MTKIYSSRMELVYKIAEEFSKIAEGVILTGSMAYGDEKNVTEDSDIDFILVCSSLREALCHFLQKDEIEPLARKRHFDGVCLNVIRDGVNVSVHILRPFTMDWISLTYVGDLRVFRQGGKNSSYDLNNFYGSSYEYTVKNIPTEDCEGFRTIVPVGFIRDDKYHLGIHREKLLCNPKVFQDKIGVENAITQNWWKTVKIFKADSERAKNSEFKFVNGLSRFEKFSKNSEAFVFDKLDYYMKKV